MAHHHQQTATGVVIATLTAEWRVDRLMRAVAERRFRGTGIALGALVVANDLRFLFSGDCIYKLGWDLALRSARL